MHALWIEWRTDLFQTQALLALAGGEDITADPHAAFAEAFAVTSSQRSKEARRAEIEALMAAAG